jgi:hypothetical protein
MTLHPESPGLSAASGAAGERHNDLTSAEIWHVLQRHSFAVLAYRTPAGEPRSSGVVYAAMDGHLYVVVAPDSWKARHVPLSGRVAVTVPVQRGKLLSLLFPIPPATISFHGSAVMLATGSGRGRAVLDRLRSLLPPERQAHAVLLELTPEDAFVTYGLGVSLGQMRHPELARARVPIAMS